MLFIFIIKLLTVQTPFISGPEVESQLKPMTNGRIWVRGKSVPKPKIPKTLQALKIIESELFPKDTSLQVSSSKIAKTPVPDELSWLKGMKYPDIPVVFSPQVIKYLKFYKFNRAGRAIIRDWIEKSYRYRAMILETLQRHGLPSAILYIAMIESGFSKTSRSYAGALGLWQLMPDNADVYGLERNFWVDQRLNPELAGEAVTYYFGDLYVRFGNWHTALAAYNCGYGRMLQSIRRYGTNSFWELSKFENALPRETRLYIPKMIAVAIADLNRDKFGIKNIKPRKPYAFETVYLPGGIKLKKIAQYAGIKYEKILDLNHEYVRKRLPPRKGRFQVRIPVGYKTKSIKKLKKHYPSLTKYKMYRVTFGDSLKSIAHAHDMTTGSLRRLNGIKNSIDVKIGTLLLVKNVKTRKIQIKYPEYINVPADVAIPKNMKRYFYKTKKIDTLKDIAKALNIPLKKLAGWNKLLPDANITYSMYLQIFLPLNAKVPDVLIPASKVKLLVIDSKKFIQHYLDKYDKVRISYVFRKRDTLRKIARRFGTKVSYIRGLNNKWNFKPGDKLIIYAKKKKLSRSMLIYFMNLNNGTETGLPKKQSGKNKSGILKNEKNKDKKKKQSGKTIVVKLQNTVKLPFISPVFVDTPSAEISFPYKGATKYKHAKVWTGKSSGVNVHSKKSVKENNK